MQAALTITYQPPAGATLTDPYWIRIEQVLPAPDRATVGQAASLLDAAFGLEVCEDGGEGAELVDLGQPALDEEQFLAATAEVIDLSYCTEGWDGSLDMHLKIIRSHPDLPYTLRLIGCEQTGPAVPTSSTASLIATTADTITLEWPVVGDLQCEPAPVARVGNTLRFAQDDQSATLRASWATVYDLVPIRVPAAAFEDDRDLRALAFMHGMVADERISPDAPEEPDWSLCPTTDWQAPTDDQVTCYQIVRTHRLCSCSKHEMGVSEVDEVVPCPEGIHCSNNDTECMHLMGTVSQTEYVDCGPTDRTGTFDGDLSDPNFYLEKCCKRPSVGLPQCARRTVAWRGGATINNGEQHYRDLYGPATRFVPLSPPGGICGEWTIEQRLIDNDCCYYVEPIVVDRDLSISVLGPRDWGYFSFTGGRFPVRVDLHGTGFDLDGMGLQEALIDRRSFRIYAREFACGVCEVRLSDGCTTATGLVRSTIGQWVARPGDTVVDHEEWLELQPLDPAFTYEGTCQGALPYTWCHTYSSQNCVGVGESPKWRLVEHRFHKYWGGATYTDCDHPDCGALSAPYYGHLMQVPGWMGTAWCWDKPGYTGRECDYIRYRYVWEWIC